MNRRRRNALTVVAQVIAGSISITKNARMRRTRARRTLMQGCIGKAGKEARLSYMGQALMENRHGLLVDFQVTSASGTAEREVVPQLLDDARQRGFHPRTLGADKAYDTREFVERMRTEGVTPHVAQNTTGRRSAVDGRTTRQSGY